MSRYSKAIAALLGGLTPAVVMVLLGLVGVHVGVTVATGICTVAATLATILAPANATARPPVVNPKP
jgi:hypothetical protein